MTGSLSGSGSIDALEHQSSQFKSNLIWDTKPVELTYERCNMLAHSWRTARRLAAVWGADGGLFGAYPAAQSDGTDR